MALRAFYSFLAFSAVIVLYFALMHIPEFFSFVGTILSVVTPFIVGFVIAYLLNPCYNFFRKKVVGRFVNRKKEHPKLTKGLSIFVTYTLIIGIIIFLLYIVIPQFINSITELIINIPGYYNDFTVWLEDFGFGISDSLLNDLISSFVKWFTDLIKGIKMSDLIVIKDITVSIASAVATFVLGTIASIYMLYNKEKFLAQIKKLGFSIFSRRFMLKIQRFVGESHITFGKYLSGVITDAFVVGCLTFIACVICGVPYAILVGVLVGITNVIPYFGPLIGGVPSVLIVLVINPIKALWLLIILVVVQQIDSNFITPRIVGQKTGMPALFVMFSIIFCGGMFGIIGMLIAVPLCTVVFSIIRSLVNRSLKNRRLPTHSDDYVGVSIIEMVEYRSKTEQSEDDE